jgi:hypothetical protein
LVFAEFDRLTAWTLIGTGFVCIGIARAQLAAARFTIDQIAYFTSGFGSGFFLLILGLALLISADLQDEKFKVDRLHERVAPGKSSEDSAALRPGRHPLRGPAILIGLAGAAALVTLGWWRASSGASVDEALAGPLFATAGLLLSAGAVCVALRRESRQLGQWRRVLLEPFEEDDRATTAAAIATDHDGEWTLPGARRSHRRACQALAFPDAQPVWLPPGAESLEPCLLCHTEATADE